MCDVFASSLEPNEPFPPALDNVMDGVRTFGPVRVSSYDDMPILQKHPALGYVGATKIVENEALPGDLVRTSNSSMLGSTVHVSKISFIVLPPFCNSLR